MDIEGKLWFTILDRFNHITRQTGARVLGMLKLGPKIPSVLVLGAVGVFLSYFVLELFSETFPEYPYRPYPDTQPDPGIASTPRIRSLPPLGPVAPAPPAEAPPATPAGPTAPSTPTPLPVKESATTTALLVPAPVVTPSSTIATPPRNAHHGSDTSPPPAVSLGRPEFHVQAGAFKERESADAVIRQLRANGYTVTLVEGALLRVWVGPAMSRTGAEQLAATLRSKGFETFLSPVR